MALLEIRKATRRFGHFVAVREVSLEIEAGEFFTLLGPSGCGKTTLLRLIAGFDTPDEGRILLDGCDITLTPPERRPVHTIFQSYALFPHMTVADNVAFPLRMARVAHGEIRVRVAQALREVQLAGMGERLPQELSGGQKQRVAIARALIDRPRVLLLDEPLAALDLKLREQMQLELITLQRLVGITFVYVTHDQGEALALSHRIGVMNAGRIVQLGAPDAVYEFPQTRFVADFIGTCNLLEGTVRRQTGARLTLEVSGLGELAASARTPVQVGERGVLAVRPEKVRIAAQIVPAPGEVHLQGVIHDQLYLGDVTVYKVELAGGRLLEALLPNSAAGVVKFFEVGDHVDLAWRAEAALFLHD
ncbi:MAG: ABC transporter ATP-binding protein [Betaproteobacteria bacterium]|nr:ABC transporter ATP-binding protein [Betaproteobacteria bacterium]